MTNTKTHRIASRVVGRVLTASSGTQISVLLQNGASSARIALDALEDAIESGLSLINASEKKEHIYAEAGDLIVAAKATLQEIRVGVETVAYAAAKLDEKSLKTSLPIHTKEQIDDAVKRDV